MALSRWMTLGVIALGLTVAGPIGLAGCEQESEPEQAAEQAAEQADEAMQDAAEEANAAAEEMPEDTGY